MITASFYVENGHFIGFMVSGHAGAAEHGRDILCAGVSSAVMLTINTLTDYSGVKAVPKVCGGKAGVRIVKPEQFADNIILSLEAHLKALAKNSLKYTDKGKIRIIRKTNLK